MPDLSSFHRDFVFLHVLGVFVFLLAHGVSAAVLFRVRAERDPVALRSLLALSEAAMIGMGVGFLVLLATGILAGFSGNYWTSGRLWLWASVAVFVVVVLLMTPLARFPLDRVRTAVGLKEQKGRAEASPPIAESAAIEAATASVRPWPVAAVGLGGVALLAWLMMYKPF